MLGRIGISIKILSIIGVMAAVMLGLTGILLDAMTRSAAGYERLLKGEDAAKDLSLRIQLAYSDFGRQMNNLLLLQNPPEGLPPLETNLVALIANRDALRHSLSQMDIEGLPALIAEMKRQEAFILSAYRATVAVKRSGAPDQDVVARRLWNTVGRPAVVQIAGEITTFGNVLTERVQDRTKTARSDMEQLQRMAWAGTGAALAFGVGFSLFVARAGITAPMARMSDAMSRLARGDLGTDIPGLFRRDELGGMAKAVQTFKENGLEMRRMSEAAEALNAAAAIEQKAAMCRTADGFEAKVGNLVSMLAAAATELQTTAGVMTSTAERTNAQAESVANAAADASGGVRTVAAAAEQLSASIAEIGRQVARSTDMSGRAVQDARRTDGIVQELAEGAQRIGRVVELISSIAGQTNLLALNATIEAARAGDAGKGFAVVASEVKNLAQQTAQATKDIAGQIANIQGTTADVVKAIQAIGATIDDVSAIATAIACAVEEQGAATAEIARNVQLTAASTVHVSTAIGTVTEAANDTGAAASQVLGAAGELSQQAEQLRNEVSIFVAGVRAA